MELFVFLWIVSPIFLIPMYISSSSKKKKLEKFITQLLSQNRISITEFHKKNADNISYVGQQETQPFEQPAQPDSYASAAGFTEYTPQPAENYVPEERGTKNIAAAVQPQTEADTANESFAATLPAEMPASQQAFTPAPVAHESENAYNTVPGTSPVQDTYSIDPGAQFTDFTASYVPKKRERNPASALLGIGTALIILAGIVFSKMTWLQMNDWQRSGIIALASAFFFIVSIFSLKKLKLDNTSMAFYMLGSVFASITFLTVCIFGLLGDWLSINGDGSLIVYAIASLIMTLLSVLGVRLYDKGGFVHAALYGGLCSFTLISMQVINDREWWAFALNLIAALPIFLMYKNKLKTGSRHDASLQLFAIIIAVFYFMAALPYMLVNIEGSWSLPVLLTALVWLAQAIFYGSRLDNKLLKNLHSALSALIAYEAVYMIIRESEQLAEHKGFIFACTFFMLGLVWRLAPALRTRLSDYIYPIAVFLSGTSLPDNSIKDLTFCLLTPLMLTALIALTAAEKENALTNKLFRIALPMSSVYTCWRAALLISERYAADSYEISAQAESLSMMLLCFGTAFIFARIERIHTGFSDIVFPFAIFCCGVSMTSLYTATGDRLAFCAFLLDLVLMLMTASGEAAASKIIRYTLIIPVIFMISSAGYTLADIFPVLDRPGYHDMLCACMLVLVGAAFRFSAVIGVNIRTVISDLGFVCLPAFIGLSLFGYSSEHSEIFPIVVFLLVSLLILTHVCERKPKGNIIPSLMKLILPVSLLIDAYAVYCAVEDVSKDNLYPEAFTLMAIIALLFVIFDRVEKLRTAFSDLLFPIAAAYVTLSVYGSTNERLVITLIFSAMICAMLTMQGLEKDKGGHLIINRIAAPLPLFIINTVIAELIYNAHKLPAAEDIAYIITALTAGAGAAVFTWLVKTKPDKVGSVCTPMQYSWTAVTGMLTLGCALSSPYDVSVLLAAAIISILMYLLCSVHKNDLLSAGFVISFCISCLSMSFRFSPDTGTHINYAPYIVLFSLIAAAVLWSGRLLFKERLIDRSEGLRIDLAAFGSAIVPLFVLSNTGYDISYRAGGSLALILGAGFFANLMRPGNSGKTNRILLSLASACLCALVYTRPFLLTDDPAINAKIDLIPLLLFGVIIRRIWHEDQKLSSNLSFGINLTALVFLLLDALMHQSLGNTIFVLCVTLAVMLWSFAKRNGRWFAISAACFIGLTLYITHDFFGRAEWWVYLLAAGLILISVAAVNEYLKSNGKSLKEVISQFSERWRK